ncbi:alanine racemase, partial [Desulfovibrio sp. OttesenSCG-928-A18]|nr:alanine racemase [Desulfovibrio sp. OttesenSCG-928-A18]
PCSFPAPELSWPDTPTHTHTRATMMHSPHLPVAHIYLDRIRGNYRLLSRIAGAAAHAGQSSRLVFLPARQDAGDAEGIPFIWPDLMPVIKADAYGHGHIQVAAALIKEGASLFASGSVAESLMLRQTLLDLQPEAGAVSPRSFPMPGIVSMLGALGLDEAYACAEHGIVTMLHGFEQLDILARVGRPLAVAVKCNTGMSRLGFSADELPLLVERLRALPRIKPVLAVTHMHSADTEQGPDEVRAHARAFAPMLDRLREFWPQLAASIGNSAGTMLSADIAGIIGPHICRPGIALYGGNPFAGTSHAALGEGLKPAMALSAPVMALRELARGEGIGYGHSFKASGPMRVAIVAAGYAECFSRAFSNNGRACIRGVSAPVVGRVSMQMTALDVSRAPDLHLGDQAWLLGGPFADAPTVEELARNLGTISYELLCLFGYNTRVYE